MTLSTTHPRAQAARRRNTVALVIAALLCLATSVEGIPLGSQSKPLHNWTPAHN